MYRFNAHTGFEQSFLLGPFVMGSIASSAIAPDPSVLARARESKGGS
jgi:hypothetical protein